LTDTITILTHVAGARLAKFWREDGTIEQYEDAKTYTWVEKPVASLDDLASIAGALRGDRSSCVIRGAYRPELANRRVERNTESTWDKPHQWLMIDIDGFEPIADWRGDPTEAIDEFIVSHLPPAFHDASYYWHLSGSAGAPGKEDLLKAHVWFWLTRPVDSPTLREWAKTLTHVDPAVFRQVQPHYTSDPVFEVRRMDPVKTPRSGIRRAMLADEVDLDLGYAPAGGPAPWDDGADVDIEKLRDSVPGYDVDRVRDELLVHLDPNMHHDEWVQVGMALHHQGNGDTEWLELWDEWSSHGASYTPDVCEARWESFNDERMAGSGSITLRWLMKLAKPVAQEAVKVEAKETAQPGIGHGNGVLLGLMKLLGYVDDKLFGSAVAWHSKKFDRTLGRMAWDPNSSKFRLMSSEGDLLVATVQDAPIILRARELIDFFDYDGLMSEIMASPAYSEIKAADARQKLIDTALFYPIRRMLELVKAHRQFTTVSATVDMFAKRGGMKIADGVLTLVYPHEPLKEGAVDAQVLTDYRAHFPQFDDFLELLAAARFASDRKSAHLWMQADSNWGKGFLASMLRDHGLVMETSVAEVEKLVSGAPAGLTLEAMRRVWVLMIDEFKGVTRELKQLSSSISFSPKNQARVTVPLYLKLFLSAEDVPSLLSDSLGAEDQFLNRFMHVRLPGTLDGREVFERSHVAYARTVRNYIAQRLNVLIEEYRALGEEGAADKGDRTLRSVHRRFPLGDKAQSLDQQVPAIAGQFAEDLAGAHHDMAVDGRTIARSELERLVVNCVFVKDGAYYVRRADKALEQWIALSYPKNEAAKVAYKRAKIKEALGGSIKIRVPGVPRNLGTCWAVSLGKTVQSMASEDDDDPMLA
jgi:hypothetical protein